VELKGTLSKLPRLCRDRAIVFLDSLHARTNGKPMANRSRRIFGNQRNKLTPPPFSGANPYTLAAKCLKMPTPEYYRKKAEEMRRQAQRAATAELRASYLAIAEDWDRLAKDADADAAFSEREGEPSTKG